MFTLFTFVLYYYFKDWQLNLSLISNERIFLLLQLDGKLVYAVSIMMVGVCRRKSCSRLLNIQVVCSFSKTHSFRFQVLISGPCETITGVMGECGKKHHWIGLVHYDSHSHSTFDTRVVSWKLHIFSHDTFQRLVNLEQSSDLFVQIKYDLLYLVFMHGSLSLCW